MQPAFKRPAPPIPATSSPDDLKAGLYRILFGISAAWGLDQIELAAVLQRRSSTISEWKKNHAVSVSADVPSPNDQQIYEFIEFYDSVSSLFARVEDQIKWLKSPSEDFGGASPLELLKKSGKNLFFLREWVDHLARP